MSQQGENSMIYIGGACHSDLILHNVLCLRIARESKGNVSVDTGKRAV